VPVAPGPPEQATPLREIRKWLELRLAAIRSRVGQPDRHQKPGEKIDATLGQTPSDISYRFC
jgi:hypothetical protein